MQLAGARRTLVEDDCGILRVDAATMLGYDRGFHEPCVFPSQVEQLFYVQSSMFPSWKFAIAYTPRGQRVFNSTNIVRRPDEVEEIE